MFDFTKVETVLKNLSLVQGNEKDQRELARMCNTFVTKVDGQWEPSVWANWGREGRPRYNFDRVSPIIDMIVGELEQNEFAATVSPADGQATKDIAEVIDGMIRAIQNHSGAQAQYKKVARKLVTMGFDAMRVSTDWKEGDSFQQELQIEHIANSIDRVWFDPNSEKQDRSDADWVVVMQALVKEVYEEKFPDGSGNSVDTAISISNYDDKRETVVVGQLYWKAKEEVTIIQLSNGDVIQADEVPKEMADFGITEVKRRKRDIVTVKTRLFDGEIWLNKEEDTVFSELPIIPFYHGFEISEDKIIWRRIVEKLMDPQRIYNYAKSRQIEEGALAPREKTWMTRAQAKGHEAKLATMNTNADPVQFYNPDDKAPAPYKTSPPSVNPALQTTAMDAAADIEAISGMYAANLAKNPGNQSGKAIGLQMDKGDTGNVSFYADMAIGITYLCKVLVNAIPRVHDTAESFSLIQPDGNRAEVKINTPGRNEAGEVEMQNDITTGTFSVICEMGSMFKNQLEKGNAALIELGSVMPEVLQGSADVFVRNIPAPGMDAVADRVRAQLFKNGAIPEDQWTDEEREQVAQEQAAAQENQQPDPNMVFAQAEMLTAQVKQAEVSIKQEKNQIDMAKVQLTAQDIEQKNQLATAETVSDIRDKQAGTQKTLQEAEGVAIDNQIKLQDAASEEIRRRVKLMSISELASMVGRV